MAVELLAKFIFLKDLSQHRLAKIFNFFGRLDNQLIFDFTPGFFVFTRSWLIFPASK
jgi:hypothetical protein